MCLQLSSLSCEIILAHPLRIRSTAVMQMNELGSKRQAVKGGETGANGEWYKGGAFINTVAENPKGSPKQKVKPCGKRNTAPGVWEIQPNPDAIALFPQLSGIEYFDRATGTFRFNDTLRSYFATPEAIENRKAKIAAYNAGERWV